MIPSRRRGALLLLLLQIGTGAALAQTQQTTDASVPPDRGGLALRELSVSSGYGAVQLPPITLGGYLPNDVFQNDLGHLSSSGVSGLCGSGRGSSLDGP